MPIYAYRCAACGHARDVLQKISDPVLTDCPACGAARFEKQLTAAGFHLKGSGWYATDFRNGNGKGGEAKATTTDGAKPDAPAKAADGAGKSDGAAKPEGAASASSPAAPAASAAPSAGGCGSSCGCH